MFNQSQSKRMAILSRCALFATVLLCGCASPIKSQLYSDVGEIDPLVANASKKELRGFLYNLTASKISVNLAVRLESCREYVLSKDKSPSVIPPRVIFLEPTIVAVPIADGSAVFRVDPADSFNLFKSNAGSEISLTADRRLGKAKAKTEDTTVNFLKQLVDFAALRTPMFASRKNAIEGVAPTEATNCTEETHILVSDRKDSENAKTLLLKHERELLVGNLKKGDAEVLKTYADALSQLEIRIAFLNEQLTKRTSIVLVPDSTLLFGARNSAVTRFDLQLGWFNKSTGVKGCVDPDSTEKNPFFEEESDASLLNCLEIVVSVVRPLLHPSANLMRFVNEPYPGLIYRMPVSATVEGNARVLTRAGNESSIEVELASFAPLPAPYFAGAFKLGNKARKGGLFEKRVPIAQWGPLATLNSDLNLFGSSGISVEFDDWSVPKTVSWSAESGGVAGIIGLSNQAEAARQKANAVSPVDPIVNLRGELLLRLLQSCVDSPLGTLPTYCTGLAK